MKKIMTLAAALAFFAGPASAITFDWGKIENLVPQGATVVVSSKPGESATIVDRNDGTRWQAVAKAHEFANDWVLIDLGESKTFTDIEIKWEASHASAYEVYVSNEAPAYTATEFGTETYNVIDADWLAANTATFTSTIAGEASAIDILTNESGITGRYILIYCTAYNGYASDYGSSIFEVRVAKIDDRSILELPVPTSVPVPAHDETLNGVISLMSAKYTAASNHGMQEWGSGSHFEDITIDGAPVMKVTSFNYVGWDGFNLDVTSCNMMHVDFFASNAGGFGFTPISPGKEKPWIASEVKVGEWNSYDVPLTHWDNVDFTNVIQIKFDQGNRNQEGYVANVYFYHDDSQADLPSYEYGNKWYGSATADCTKNSVTYSITADYVFTAEQDGLAMEFTFDGEEAVNPTLHQVHVIKTGVDQWVSLTRQDDAWVGKCTLDFTLGESINEMEFYLPYEGNRWNYFVRNYKFGASNEAPTKEPKLTLSAKVDEVGFTTAVISYTAKASNFGEGTWKVMLDDVEISESPYTITGLEELTSYTYTIKAVGEVDGATIESAPVELAFKTKSSTAVAKTWYSINDGKLKNAYLVGETPDMKRDIPASIESEVTYNTDGTITVVSTPHLPGNVVGLVPKITISSNDYKSEYLVMNQVDGKWSITTSMVYPEEHAIGWLFYQLAYAGADLVINVPGYTTGFENEKPSYGEPAKLDFNLSKTGFAINENVLLDAVVSDAAGHYLFGNPVEFAVSGSAFSIDGAQLTATSKGTATVTATSGTLSAVKEVLCHSSADATRIEHKSLSGDHDALHLAFDGNEGTQIEWNCATTEEHNLIVDLGKKMNIEVITLVWEGASATHYTVRLHNDAPAAGAPARRAPAAKDGALYTIENGAGGAGVTVRTDLYQDDLAPVTAQYVELNTTKAFNAGWGIKLKEMSINGTEASDTNGIMEAAVDTDAPVEVYNLAGMKVADSTAGLPAGIYIVRQGTATTKTVIR